MPEKYRQRRARKRWERMQRNQQYRERQSGGLPAGWDLPRQSTPNLPGVEGLDRPVSLMEAFPNAFDYKGTIHTYGSYWEDPQKIIKWYDQVQANPSTALPEGIDKQTIEGVYDYLKYRNQDIGNRDLWRSFIGDPFEEYARSLPQPSTDFLTDAEAQRYNIKTQAEMTPGGTSQVDYTAPDFDWTRLTVEQKQTILNNPNFGVSKVVAPGQQGLILSDPEFDFWGKARRGELPWWQPVAYSVLSNPKTTPLVQGAALTLMTGGKGLIFAIPMTLLGYGAQSENEAIRATSETLLKPFIWGSQTTEQVAGFTRQEYETFKQISERPDQASEIAANFVNERGGPLGLIRGFLSAQIGKRPTDPEALQGYAAWEANKSFYESLAGPEVWVLGENKKIPVPPGYSMEDARQRILDGESSDAVMADFIRVYGINGVATDFTIQSIADPLNVLPEATGLVRAEIATGKARKFYIEAGKIKETGALDPVMIEKVNRLEARAAIEQTKATVFRTSPGTTGLAIPFGEAGRKFRALIESGAITAEQAKYMTPWERRVAGITPDGRIRELLPQPLGETRVPKFLQRMVTLQPKAKAKIFLEKFSGSLASLFNWGKMTDASPRELVGVLKATSSLDMETLHNVGAEFMSSPEAYTTIGAVRDLLPKIDDKLKAYEVAEPNRQLFWQVQALLGDDPRTVLKNFLDGDPAPDWQRFHEALRRVDTPETRAMLEQIREGTLTPETLTKAFKPFKDGNVALTPDEFSAGVLNVIEDHMSSWGKEYFGLKQDSIWEDSLRLLKGAQSLVLLDLSPATMVNDFINERVLMASTGTLGLTPGKVVDAWIEQFGIPPKRGGYGILGDLPRAEGMIETTTKGRTPVTSMADGLNKFRSYLLRPQASARFNEAHGKQIFYKQTKTFWSRQWRVGKGFDRMPAGLEVKLREYGIEPKLVYDNLSGVLTTEHLNLLNERITTADVNVFVEDAAQQLGRDPADITTMLDQLGVMDDLRERLSTANTAEKRRAAFDAVENKVMENYDIRQAQGLRGLLEQIRNQIATEGPAGVVRVFHDITMDYFERKVENDRIWDQAFELSEQTNDYQTRQMYKREAARKNNAAWRRTQGRQAALFTAAMEGLGLEKEFSRTYLTHLSEQHNILRDFFSYKNRRIEKFFNTDFTTAAERGREWYNLEAELNQRFTRDQRNVLKIQEDMNATFVDEMERTFGEPGGAMARAWTDSVIKNSHDIHEVITAFRDRLHQATDMPPEFESVYDWRRAEWERFKPEYRAMWAERMRVDMEGANNLYKWDQGGGEPTPPPAGPSEPPPPPPAAAPGAPPAPETPPTQSLIDAHRAAKEAEKANLSSMWDVAEEYSKMQPGNSSNYDRGYIQDNFALLGALKKAQYGGDPSIKNMTDAARKLTPERVREILDNRARIKQETIDAENAAREARLAEVRAEAQRKAAARKKPENVTILGAIKKRGGIDWAALENFGEKDAKGFPPGTFSKRGKRRWALDQMAQLLADDGYPIDMNRPDDVGGVQQTIDLIRRQQQGEPIYPVGHDVVITEEMKAAEIEAAARILEEDTAAVHDMTTWERNIQDAADAGDFGQMGELISALPDEMARSQRGGVTQEAQDFINKATGEGAMPAFVTNNLKRIARENGITVTDQMTAADVLGALQDRATGETYADYAGRLWDETDARIQQEKLAKEQTTSQIAMDDQVTAGDVAMTRQRLADAYAEAFPNATREQIDQWMEVSDVALETIGGYIGESLEDMYSRYRGVIRGSGGEDMPQLLQSAFHGSPYRFDRFTLNKIGSGEGAQQYGWGLYFTDSRAVAEHYRRSVSGYQLIENINSNLRKTSLEIERLQGEGYGYDSEVIQKQVDIYSDLMQEREDIRQGKVDVGQVYKVDIPDESSYLLWDKPLSEQPQAVKDAIVNLYNDIINKEPDYHEASRLSRVDILDETAANNFYDYLSDVYGDPKAASLALNEAGITGIKYLDALSRAQGEGSYNYVVFDDASVNILETYYQADPTAIKGGVSFLDGQAIIHAWEGGDISTVVHENAHIWLEFMQDAAKRTGNLTLLDDLNIFRDWTRLEKKAETWTAVNGKDQYWIRQSGAEFVYHGAAGEERVFASFDEAKAVLDQEMFARAFERYLSEGVAPTPKLAAIFENFKTWLINIYRKISGSGIDVQLDQPMREVFDRLLGAEDRRGQAVLEGREIEINGRRFHITEVTDTSVRMQDLTSAYPIGRVMSREAFDRAMKPPAPEVTPPPEAAPAPETPPAPAPEQPVIIGPEKQAEMFPGGEDMPLFSGTVQEGIQEVFAPETPEGQQLSFVETRPEFGEKYDANLVKIKQGIVEPTKIATDAAGDPVPEKVVKTSAATRESHLLNALKDKIDRGDWFEKSQDFENFIKDLGFNLEEEAELNLAYDVMEGAYNLRAREIRADLDTRNAPLAERLAAMEELEGNLTEARRTLGKMKAQQFSTPLTISEAAGFVADVRPGDVVGEPTAGTGNLVDRFMGRDDVTVKVNEFDAGRRQVLSMLDYDPTGVDLMSPAWVIQDGKKAGPWADVVISNPPWGAYATGKYGKAVIVPVKLNDWSQRFAYLTLERMPDGGRFVGVMPANWLYSFDRKTRTASYKPSAFYEYLKKNYTVHAVIESPPDAYKQRGTDVSSLLVVLDKTPQALDVPPVEHWGKTQPKNWQEYAGIIESVPKRTQENVYHAQELVRPKGRTGPDASGIVDPAAKQGEAVPTPERIGRPTEGDVERGLGGEPGRPGRTGERPVPGLPEERNAGDVVRDTGEEGGTRPSLVERKPQEVPERIEPRTYSDAFKKRLTDGKAAVRDSRSFTEYLARSPLGENEQPHPHPNIVVETKGLAGVPYPELEETYRPSASVMRAMGKRTLSVDGNIDPIWAAIQQNDKHGMGMLIADDVGMGKSRTAAGFVLDRIEKGRKKILVVTKDQQNVLNLMNEEFPQVYQGAANENGRYLGKPPTDYPAERVFLSGQNFPEVKKGEAPIPTFDKPAVYFVTATEFMNFADAIKDLRADTVVVDEVHLFKNADTQRGLAWVDLHNQWTKNDVSMLYLSATPGVDIADLRYMYGLKVWGMDGFDDWVKVITGEMSPDQAKRVQATRAKVDDWVVKLQEARDKIRTRDVEIEQRYSDPIRGKAVGDVEFYKSRESYDKGSYHFTVRGEDLRTRITTDTEAAIVADIVNKRLGELPADPSWNDVYDILNRAESAYDEAFTPPEKSEINQVGMKDASDIISKAEKGKWGKKGLGAFESTLPPAHTEQIMRELKVAGSYMSRDISRAGVDFGVKEYTPPPEARAKFNQRVQLYRRITDAFHTYGKMNEGAKKHAAMFGINGDIQADAKRALFDMRMPGIIDEANAALQRGEQVVISVVSVSEVDGETGSLVSAIDKINTKKVERLGKDSFSDPEEIPEALVDVLTLKEDLKDLGTLPSPIDVLRDAFGNRIDFVTGATSTKDRIAAQRAFQANKLDVLVISGAGKTGINLHDVTGKKRIHLIVGDYEWSATNFKQELGRVDRTGQQSAPMVTVMHTGSAGERKFVATISNRMKGLGATSKGGAESTGTAALTDNFELGNTIDKLAVNAAWQDFPVEWKLSFLDKYFKDPQVPDVPRSTLDTNAQTISKFLLGLQSIELDTANKIMDTYLEKRAALMEGGVEGLEEAAARSTAANTGEIIRQVELGDNLRMSEVRAEDGSKFAILDGVLTPHMNDVRGVVTAGGDAYQRFMEGGRAWMRWVQFYDPEKKAYVTGLRVKPSKIKDVAARFGQIIGSGHKPETALIDLNAGDRIQITGANVAEWELYMGRGGSRENKIVVDNARIRDKDVLMNNGAQYSAIGNFFYVPEERLQQFLKRFPIRSDTPPDTPTLYQTADTPMFPPGGYEQSTGYVDYAKMLLDGYNEEVAPVMDAMKASASRPEQRYNFGGMDADTQVQLNDWLKDVNNKMASTKKQAAAYGEAQRDFALLDYSRQYGFDKPLSTLVPYEFFNTRSMANWFTRAADRPAWIAQYQRLQQLHNTYESQLPERMRNKLYIPMPFLPKWAGGGVFIDPTWQLFPWRQFTQPLESMMRDNQQIANSAAYVLRRQAEDGVITMERAQKAIDAQSGPDWENAIAQAKLEQGENRNTGADYFNMILSPALYLTLPYYLATGKKAGPFGWPSTQLPITRFGQGLQTAFKDTPLEWAGNIAGSLAAPERWARKAKGLNEFGQWGEYYVERQLANMVAEGAVDTKDAERAMMEKSGPLYDQALERVKQELMLKVPGMAPLYGIGHGATLDQIVGASLTSLFPGGLLPPGEMEYKGLKQEYGLAWEAKKNGNDQAINDFFDEHPEYSARLALRRDPAERMNNFLRSEIWDALGELSPTDKKQANAFLGPQFDNFYDSEIEIPTEQLTRWVRMLKGMVPATTETQPFLEQPVPNIDYYTPEVTDVTDRYFTERKEQFPHYYALQQTYYSLPPSDRNKFLLQFPEYARYREWQKKYYKDYPELKPIFNGEVFRRIDTSAWPTELTMTVTQAAYTGDDLPSGAEAILQQVWYNEGQPYGDFDNWVQSYVYPSILNQQMQELVQ